MPILLVKSGTKPSEQTWQDAFAQVAPWIEVRDWNDPAVDPLDVHWVLVWDPEPGRLAACRNLKVVFGTGAGVDAILADPTLPPHLPIIRMATPGSAQRMGEYVCWAALSLLKDARRMALQQAARAWTHFDTDRAAPQVPVGVLGLGHMGARAAAMLAGLGFPVLGWSRTPKAIPGVESFCGPEGLEALLPRARILACLLPATAETRGLIAAPLLAKLPRGAGLVNAGRGSQQVLDDILAALDSGHLSGAVLDVFEEEPLPPGHRAWSHPRVTVTPHVASLPPRTERAAHVADLIARHARGEALPNAYDRGRGY